MSFLKKLFGGGKAKDTPERNDELDRTNEEMRRQSDAMSAAVFGRPRVPVASARDVVAALQGGRCVTLQVRDWDGLPHQLVCDRMLGDRIRVINPSPDQRGLGRGTVVKTPAGAPPRRIESESGETGDETIDVRDLDSFMKAGKVWADAM